MWWEDMTLCFASPFCFAVSALVCIYMRSLGADAAFLLSVRDSQPPYIYVVYTPFPPFGIRVAVTQSVGAWPTEVADALEY